MPVDGGQHLDTLADPFNNRCPDEHSVKGPVQTVDVQVGLEGVDLAAVAIARSGDIEDTEAALGGFYDFRCQQDQPRAGRKNRETRSDLVEHPQIRANDILMETDHETAGRLRQARPAARFSEVDEAPVRGAPPLAADTRAVLADAGYDAAAIEVLIETGAAASADDGEAE